MSHDKENVNHLKNQHKICYLHGFDNTMVYAKERFQKFRKLMIIEEITHCTQSLNNTNKLC